MKRQISLAEGKALAVAFLRRHRMSEEHAGMVADHLVYAHMAGHDFAGFPRLIPLSKMLQERGLGGTLGVLRETDKSAQIDGAGVNGYVTSVQAMDKAIALAKVQGVGIVGVSDSWFSGMLRYYVERAADAGLIGIHAANTTARVAPFGGVDRLLGTNPICFAFPSDDAPMVIDLSTAATMWGDVLYQQQMGRPLAEGVAVDAQGAPTVDPAAALTGAFLAWGGIKGSSLSVIVQALGILGGSDPVVGDRGKWGYFFMALDPELLMPVASFRKNISALRAGIQASRPVEGLDRVRVPGDATQAKVSAARERGWIEVEDEILNAVAADPGY